MVCVYDVSVRVVCVCARARVCTCVTARVYACACVCARVWVCWGWSNATDTVTHLAVSVGVPSGLLRDNLARNESQATCTSYGDNNETKLKSNVINL